MIIAAGVNLAIPGVRDTVANRSVAARAELLLTRRGAVLRLDKLYIAGRSYAYEFLR